MNVIIVNDYSYINGGAGEIAVSTALALAERGHEVIFFTAVDGDCGYLRDNTKIKLICTNQYDILNNPNRLSAAVQGVWNSKAAKTFEELLKSFSPCDTIIHIHSVQKAISTSILPVARKRGFKVLYHYHDYGSVCPNLGLFNYPKQTICRYEPMSLACMLCNCDSRCYLHKIWRVLRQLVQIHFGGLPGKIDGGVFVSDFSKKILGRYVDEGRMIPNPVNIPNRYKVDASANEYALYIGRLSPEKNPVLLAKAARELNVPAIFIGSGICQETIQKENPSAICTGWLTKEDMLSYIAKARYLVFPSLLYETQGLVVAEVMAYGVPAIVSDSCAATDFVSDSYNGLLFSNGDIESLKKAMSKMSDDSYVAELSENAFKAFQSTNEEYIAGIERYYEDLLAIKQES